MGEEETSAVWSRSCVRRQVGRRPVGRESASEYGEFDLGSLSESWFVPLVTAVGEVTKSESYPVVLVCVYVCVCCWCIIGCIIIISE